MTIILGVVGGVIGSFYGNWTLGWSIGTTLGALLDGTPGSHVEQGKLNDLHFSGSQYGSPIPKIWGKAKVGGNVIWVQNWKNGKVVPSGTLDAIHLVEHTETSSSGGGGSGGGGGVSTTTYWYSASYQILLCEASTFKTDGTFVYRNPVVKRVWADDILIYDVDNTANNKVTIRFLYGDESQTPDSLISSSEGVNNTNANRGVVSMVFQDHDLRNNGNRIPTIQSEIWFDAVAVKDICEDVCGEVGLLSSRINFSSATASVTGFYINNRQDAQTSLDPLLAVFATDPVDIDGKFTLVPRGGSSIRTIPLTKTGAVLTGSKEFAGRVNFSRGVRSELPGKFEVSYFDVNNTFNKDVQSDINDEADYLNPTQIDIPMCLTANEARQYAARLIDTSLLEYEPISIVVGPEYCDLVPSDIITLTGTQNDWTFSLRYRITSITQTQDMLLTFNLVRDELYVLNQLITGATGTGGGSSGSPAAPVPCLFTAWSGIEIADADKTYDGFYVAATWPEGGKGGTVMYSPDSGVSWVNAGYISSRIPWGSATSVLADGASAGSYDTTHTVDVELQNDGVSTLISRSQDDVKSGQNAVALMKSDGSGEILGFVNASATTDIDYTLSDLYRGWRGSTYTGHGSSELFVLLSRNVLRVNVNSSYVGSTFQVKVLAPGQVLADVTAVNVTILARTPSDLEAYVNSLKSPKSRNTFFAGPVSGSDSAPTWRAINHDDMDWAGSIHGYGNTASKPAASAANAGYFYYDTTTQELQRSNGSTWNVLASGVSITINQATNADFMLMGA